MGVHIQIHKFVSNAEQQNQNPPPPTPHIMLSLFKKKNAEKKHPNNRF